MRYNIVGGAYQGRSVEMDSQECFDAFLEVDPEEPTKPVALVGRPGLSLYKSAITVAEGRGLHYAEAAGKRFAVIGQFLYEFNGSTATNRGTLLTSEGAVSMANNGVTPGGGNQLLIVDGTYGYLFNYSTNTFTQNIQTVDSDFPDDPGTCTFQDGYFIVNAGGTGRFYISDSYNGLSWTATDFATAEGDPDNLFAVLNDRRELWLFGGRSTEIWYNSGDADFPFSRYQGGFLEVGIAARSSVAKFDNSLVWLATTERGSRQFVKATSGGVQIISTPSVAWQLNDYGTVSDANAYTFQLSGHEFYVCNFPTEDVTWVYDAVSQKWFKWSYWNEGTREQFKGAFYCFDGTNHLVLDPENGEIYTIEDGVDTDDGDTILFERTGTHLYFDGRRVQVQEFELLFEKGVGLASGQGSDPQAMLSWSTDGGHTYGNELLRSMGAIGQYYTRAVWRKIGTARDIVFRIRISDPVKRVITGAWVRLRNENAPQ
jgi:hypothetical protein